MPGVQGQRVGPGRGDEAGKRRDVQVSFLAIELINLWWDFTGERPKQSHRTRPGESSIGEFGLMVEAVLDLMVRRGIISKVDKTKLDLAVMNRLDHSKSRDWLL